MPCARNPQLKGVNIIRLEISDFNLPVSFIMPLVHKKQDDKNARKVYSRLVENESVSYPSLAMPCARTPNLRRSTSSD
jgi:hypothetical protein